MAGHPNVVVVLARCRITRQLFGIRIEEKYPTQWLADWAFSIHEKQAKKEGYGNSQIRGSFGVDMAVYPGCPNCQAPGFFKCSCGKLGCWDGESRTVTCPWCGARIELGGSIDALSAGGDR